MASHSWPQCCCMGEMPQHSPHPLLLPLLPLMLLLTAP